ncbi:MAG: deoxyribose-phosphate aldolase [Clostridium sp.]
MNKKELAQMIDHTILKPEATEAEIMQLCKEAVEYGFASVCINPSMVKKASIILEGSEVKVCTVIGFPLGATTTEVKAFETEQTIKDGATEVDMVINVGKLKENNLEYVKNDIAAVVNAANGKAITKVIIESCLLSDEEKVAVCKIAKEVGADFVKTSTGFSSGGATKEDIKLMRETVGPDMGVKASGGVRSHEDAITMIENGATRIGASASIAICNGTKSNSNY